MELFMAARSLFPWTWIPGNSILSSFSFAGTPERSADDRLSLDDDFESRDAEEQAFSELRKDMEGTGRQQFPQMEVADDEGR
jgi:hypothetical protein